MFTKFDVCGFNPSEPGWIVAYLTVHATDESPAEYDVYPLLGWADISVEAYPESFPTVVPVTAGAQGDGHLAITYEPDERFAIYYAPKVFRVAQAAGVVSMTGTELTAALHSVEVPGA